MVYRRRQQERRERIGRQTILLVRQRVPSGRVHALLFQNARERTERSRQVPLHDTVLRVRTAVQIHRVRPQIRVKSLYTAGFPQGLLGASIESKHEGRRQLRIRSYPLSGQVAQIQQQRENDIQLLRLGEGQHHAQMPPLPETCPAPQTVDRDIHGQGRCCHRPVRRKRHDPVCGSLIGKKGIWLRGQQAIL